MGGWQCLAAPEAPGFFQFQQPLHHLGDQPQAHLVLITATQASLCEGNKSLISLIKVKYDPFLCLRILLPRLRESSFLFIRNEETLHQEGGWAPEPGE